MSELAEQLPHGSGSELVDRYQHAVMNTFGPPKRVFVRGEGAHVWDSDGNRYLDLLAGIAVNGLGHAHPAVLAAITAQLATLGHVSNFFATPAQIALAERLVAMVGGTGGDGKVFFANSGTEANEAAFKLTRRTGRTKLIAMEGAFHGRSMGALALTHNAKYREPFEPLPGEVTWVPYGDADALAEAVDDTVAAVVIEPIQGENGIIVPPDGYLTAAREITREHGALLWFDEVQTGVGRTGRWLASQHEGVVADVVTLAKGLGNGFPIGACVATGTAADLLQPGMHGTTFGGNPVAAIAGLAVLQVIERDGLLDHATALGERLEQRVAALEHPLIDHVRGRGLLRGIVLTKDIAPAAYDAALQAGFVINAPRPHVIRLVPPLNLSTEQLDSFIDALPAILEQARGTSKENA
ncbi:acetylornithine transaminase [Enemella evansiae]|uniref:acetylornithine transaminase n=1 Tax=Enemella evansiae TaxID=2016499 RepID=UPI00105C907C|nr:acetylornithine transaminase [Enemella evansiae]TDO92704.1 acetylornithine aminotransferase [Enemella evansiae]